MRILSFSKKVSQVQLFKYDLGQFNKNITKRISLLNYPRRESWVIGFKILVKTRKGVYEVEANLILKGCALQEPLQAMLNGLFLDLINIRGTHGLSKFIYVNMFPTGVDRFMKALSFGYRLRKPQNYDKDIRELKDLGPVSPRVIITGDSLALAKGNLVL
eukprot:snap_masked-scaffold_7-processed-gene-14.11-mRNA-1 protein AED:1.00 eAED:1.00 QI:0/0/0/0/1/1/3/0/159